MLGVVEQVDLVVARYEVTESYPDQSHEQSPVVQFIEQLLHVILQQVISARIWNDSLLRHRLKIAVPHFYGYAACKLVRITQFKGDLFRHSRQFSLQESDVDRVGLESIFGSDAFLFMVGHDGRIIDAVRPSP